MGKVTLGARLKELRSLKGVNQNDVAAYLNVDRSTYGKYETGDSAPDYDKLVMLANYYDVSVDYLLGRTNNRVLVPCDFLEGLEDEDIKQTREFVRFLKMKKVLDKSHRQWGSNSRGYQR